MIEETKLCKCLNENCSEEWILGYGHLDKKYVMDKINELEGSMDKAVEDFDYKKIVYLILLSTKQFLPEDHFLLKTKNKIMNLL